MDSYKSRVLAFPVARRGQINKMKMNQTLVGKLNVLTENVYKIYSGKFGKNFRQELANQAPAFLLEKPSSDGLRYELKFFFSNYGI